MYKFIFNNFCFILTATPANHFFWVLSFTEFIMSSCVAKWIQNLWNYSHYQIISLLTENLQWMYSFSLSSMCTHTCICIYTHTNYVRTHTHKIAPSTGLLTSTERSFYQYLCCKENLWHLLATWKVSVYRLVNKYGKKNPVYWNDFH